MGLEAATLTNFVFEQGAVTTREGSVRHFEKLLAAPVKNVAPPQS